MKFLRRIRIIAILLSFVFSLTMNVNAQSAILKTVKGSGDDVTKLFTGQPEDQSYMKANITNIDQSQNMLTVTIDISNKGGTTTDIKPEINIAMPHDFAKYFDVTFTKDTGWTLNTSDEKTNTTGLVSGDTAVGPNFYYEYDGTLDNSDNATTQFVYTIKLKDGVNADDLVGHDPFQVLESALITGGGRELGYGYGPDNKECAIPTFNFVKPEENKKTGITSNVMLIAGGAFALSLIVISLSKKGKMTRI